MTPSKTSADLHFDSTQPPISLVVDPDVNFFRRLDPSEIPASINTLKGADSVLMILADGVEKNFQSAANTMVQSLGLNNYRVIPEKQVAPAELRTGDLLLIGYAATAKKLLAGVGRDHDVKFSDKRFTLNDAAYENPADSFFGVFDHPFAPGRTVALFLPLSTRYTEVVARKITHYGKYSYLAFSEGRNQVKGVWPIRNSPLSHQFDSGPQSR